MLHLWCDKSEFIVVTRFLISGLATFYLWVL